MAELHKEQCVIDLLRHGETTAGKCFLGSTDAELSELGLQQMQQSELSNNYDLIISSPLKRCKDFAQQYADNYSKPLKIEPDFSEVDFGCWETKTSEELWKSDEKQLTAFWTDPVKNTPPQAEKLLDFKKRVVERFYALTDELTGKRVLLVCHAGVIKVILCELLDIELKNMHKLTVDHGGLSRIALWQQLPQICFINQTPLTFKKD